MEGNPRMTNSDFPYDSNGDTEQVTRSRSNSAEDSSETNSSMNNDDNDEEWSDGIMRRRSISQMRQLLGEGDGQISLMHDLRPSPQSGEFSSPSIDREVFVSLQEQSFSHSTHSTGFLDSVSESSIREFHAPFASPDDHRGRPTIEVNSRQQLEPQRSSSYLSSILSTTEPSILERGQWFIGVSGESEWLRRSRSLFSVPNSMDNVATIQQPWEQETSPVDIDGVDEKSEMLSAIGFKKTYSPTNPVEVPVGLTCPSNYQRPQLSQDPSILDEGEITAYDVSYGSDPQGIPWEAHRFTRDEFRARRLHELAYEQYGQLTANGTSADCLGELRSNRKLLRVSSRQEARYRYWRTIRCIPRPTVIHFQLRHLVHAISNTDVLLSSMVTPSLQLACSVLNTTTRKFAWVHGRNYSGSHVDPSFRGITSLATKYGLVASGYMDSKVSVSDLDPQYEALNWTDERDDVESEWRDAREGLEEEGSGTSHRMVTPIEQETYFRYQLRKEEAALDGALGLRTPQLKRRSTPFGDNRPIVWRGRKVLDLLRITEEEGCIVNCVSLDNSSWNDGCSINYFNENSSLQNISLYAACNDCTVTEWALDGQMKWRMTLPWCPNCVSISPNKRLMSIGADCEEVILLDLISKRPVLTLEGHRGFTFSSAWHPDVNSFLLATGNEDSTCRIWDIRHPSVPLFTLGSSCSPVSCVTFSPDGQTLAFAESQDIIFVYNAHSQFQEFDCIDFFGGSTGLSFSPDSSRLFAGIDEPTRGGVIELRRSIPKQTLDTEQCSRISLRRGSDSNSRSYHDSQYQNQDHRISTSDENSNEKDESLVGSPDQNRSSVERTDSKETPNTWLNSQLSWIESYFAELHSLADSPPPTGRPSSDTELCSLFAGTSSTSQLVDQVAQSTTDLLHEELYLMGNRGPEPEKSRNSATSVLRKEERTSFIEQCGSKARIDVENTRQQGQREQLKNNSHSSDLMSNLAMDHENQPLNGDLLSRRIEALSSQPLFSTNLYSSRFISGFNLSPSRSSQNHSVSSSFYNPLPDSHSVPFIIDHQGAFTGRVRWSPSWDPTILSLTFPNGDQSYVSRRLPMTIWQ